MRINIITLNGYKNYGNRLQLFALSTILKKIIGDIRLFCYSPKKTSQKIKDCIKYSFVFCGKYEKERKLYFFTKKNIPKDTRDCSCDYSIVGSDQVWNPMFLKNKDYLLDVPGASNKVSYAASIGFESLQEAQKARFEHALAGYKVISVREQSAKDLLQPLTDKKIEVVLDPTLFLGREEYERLEKKPKNLADNEKYILCYVLGNRDHEEKIEKFAKEKGYKTIYFSDRRDSDYGVEEFLYLIHHAQLICTDSFHACVFSFIFERPFVAFRRTGEANYMYTRLQNLIDTFKLKNREFNGKQITKENLEVDYTEAKKILKKEQKKSLDFLKRALDIKNEN